MSRSKGGKNKHWTKEEKLRIVNRVINLEKSLNQVARDEDIAPGMLYTWVKKYRDEGEDGLINKRKPGNPLAKYQRRDSLTELERLKYENMKLKIENERLKKGYMVKGDGQTKQFIPISKKSSK